MFREVTKMESDVKKGRGRPKGSIRRKTKLIRLNFVLEEPYVEYLTLIADLETKGNLSELLRWMCKEELVRRRQISSSAKLL